MKTPTPQEQAEMLIEKHHECFGIDAKDPDLRGAIRRTELDAAIVTVEEIMKVCWFVDLEEKPNHPNERHTEPRHYFSYWQEVLTILKGKV